MNSITLNKAIEIAEKHLNETLRNSFNSPENDHWVVSQEHIHDCDDYWLMHYQSELYLKTGKPSYMLAGNLPIRVSKMGGVVLRVGKEK